MEDSSNMPSESPVSRNSNLADGEPRNATHLAADDEVSLLNLWIILWRSKWLITGVTALFIVLSIPYALLQIPWYRADVLLAPAEQTFTSA